MTRVEPASRPLVMLVDADLAVAHAIEFAFGLEGLCVRSFRNGDAALTSDQPERAGCLVVDDKLPDMEGLELVRRLRANGVGTPAILIATNPKAALRERAGRAGVPIIEKPLLNDSLIDAVRAALEARPSRSAASCARAPRDCGPASWS